MLFKFQYAWSASIEKRSQITAYRLEVIHIHGIHHISSIKHPSVLIDFDTFSSEGAYLKSQSLETPFSLKIET